MYALALVIPLLSVLGVILAGLIKRNTVRKLAALGKTREEIARVLYETPSATAPNWWILGGSLVFVAITLSVGLGGVSFAQEIVFGGSMVVILFLMTRLTRELDAQARRVLIGTALVVFIFRATNAINSTSNPHSFRTQSSALAKKSIAFPVGRATRRVLPEKNPVSRSRIKFWFLMTKPVLVLISRYFLLA